MMRQSGVGALPALDIPAPSAPADPTMAPLDIASASGIMDSTVPIPSEEKLMEDTMKGIKVLFEKQKRSQESAAVVANLLGGPGGTR